MGTHRLDGAVALVTGSTSGIGASAALDLARAGAKVIVTGRRPERGDAVVAGIRVEGLDATFVAADLTVESDVHALFDAAHAAYGDVTVLVNNAAPTDLVGPSNVDGRLTDVSTQNFEHILRTGLFSAYWCCAQAIPMMQRAGGGSIVNISSIGGVKATPRIFGYATAKGGLQALTRSVACDYAVDNIRAITVIVGFVMSNPLAEKWADDAAVSEALRGTQLTRFGVPQDIANVITFLASPAAEFLSGTDIYADGGGSVRHVVPGTKEEARRRHGGATREERS